MGFVKWRRDKSHDGGAIFDDGLQYSIPEARRVHVEANQSRIDAANCCFISELTIQAVYLEERESYLSDN